MTMNLSSSALSITRVDVYSLPILAVAMNVTPSATLIVSLPSFSSSLRYLWPWSSTVMSMFQASGCALDNSSKRITALGV